MNKDECFYLGRFIRAHSFKGELSLKLETDLPERYRELESLFIEMDGELVPFFIETIRVDDKATARVKLEDIDTIEQARLLVGKSAFLPASMLPPLKDKQFYFHEVAGFTVIDDQKGTIGTVQEVLDYPAQAVLRIMSKDDKEILVPVTKEIILKVDRKNKVLEIKAPEGLIDLYLGNS